LSVYITSMSTTSRIKTWLEGTGPKPDWIDARDPTDPTDDPTNPTDDPVVGGVRITLTKSMLEKLKTVGLRLVRCGSGPVET